MCGLFGRMSSRVSSAREDNILSTLALLSHTRGSDSHGIASVMMEGKKLRVSMTKDLGPIVTTLNKPAYRAVCNASNARVVLGHTRASTAGAVTLNNAMPFVNLGHLIGTHNGSLMSFTPQGDVKTAAKSDSLMFYEKFDEHRDFKKAVKSLTSIGDSGVFVWFDKNTRRLGMWRNEKRPLWLAQLKHVRDGAEDEKHPSLFWASEKWMIESAMLREGIEKDRYHLHELEKETLIYFFLGKTKDGRGVVLDFGKPEVVKQPVTHAKTDTLPWETDDRNPFKREAAPDEPPTAAVAAMRYRTLYEEASRDVQRKHTVEVPKLVTYESALLPEDHKPDDGDKPKIIKAKMVPKGHVLSEDMFVSSVYGLAVSAREFANQLKTCRCQACFSVINPLDYLISRMTTVTFVGSLSKKTELVCYNCYINDKHLDLRNVRDNTFWECEVFFESDMADMGEADKILEEYIDSSTVECFSADATFVETLNKQEYEWNEDGSCRVKSA